MKLKAIEEIETEVLYQIEDKLCTWSEMSLQDRKFLNGIIRTNKPKKIVEIGIAAGGSSVVILNSIKDLEGAKLFSIDYLDYYYKIPSKKCGFFVDEFPELKDKWKLYTGAIACNFLDEIGAEIDLCLIDTNHCNPGEFLDYLQVLPYMKKNGIIVLHDTTLHVHTLPYLSTCGTLLSAASGIKIVPQCTDPKFLPNIGAIILDENSMERAFDIFNCLVLPWSEGRSQKIINQLYDHYQRFYPPELLTWFTGALEYSDRLLKNIAKEKQERKELEELKEIFDQKKRNQEKSNKMIKKTIKTLIKSCKYSI